MQREYIELGYALADLEGQPRPEMIQGSATDIGQLLAGRQFDGIFSRLVLTHVQIDKTLTGLRALLRPGARIWFQQESLRTCVRKAFRAFCDRGRWIRSTGYAGFAAINSISLMVGGPQFHIAIKGRMHSVHSPAYPPVWWWGRKLRKMGFAEFKLESGGGSPAFSAVWAP